jgi:hypothetical protein
MPQCGAIFIDDLCNWKETKDTTGQDKECTDSIAALVNSSPTRAWIGSRENIQGAASTRTRQAPNSEMALAKKCTAQQYENSVKMKLLSCFRLVRQLQLLLS